MRFYAITIFIGAFLLFLVQPLIGKYILPWFGSSPSVWTTVVLFFQVVLLAGYAYAHLLARNLSNRTQALLHLALLAGVLLLLPITPSEAWKPDPTDNPTWRILLLLMVSVGGPYLLLSATSPLLQDWFARTHPGRSPYRLYAVSNAGSLLALLSYPFVVERFLRLQVQTWTWSAGFGVFAVLAATCAWRLMKITPAAAKEPVADISPAIETEEAAEPSAPGLARIFLWLALAMSGSVVLLATMNRMNQDITPVPFLFVLPLSLYLVTFIIAFDHQRWYYRPVFCVLLLLAIIGAVVVLYTELELGLIVQIALFSLALFACCMSCHGELARLKPDPKHLTLFYLMVALGGALGGFFVVVVASRLFEGYWEYEIGLAASYALVMFLVGRDLLRHLHSTDSSESKIDPPPPSVQPREKAGKQKIKKRKPDNRKAGKRKADQRKTDKPKVQRRRPSPGTSTGFVWMSIVAACLGLAVLLGAVGWNIYSERDHLIVQRRNFYGVLHVNDVLAPYPRLQRYELYHGKIMHGFQYQLPERQTWATTYFGSNTGVGLAIEHHPARAVAGAAVSDRRGGSGRRHPGDLCQRSDLLGYEPKASERLSAIL